MREERVGERVVSFETSSELLCKKGIEDKCQSTAPELSLDGMWTQCEEEKRKILTKRHGVPSRLVHLSLLPSLNQINTSLNLARQQTIFDHNPGGNKNGSSLCQLQRREEIKEGSSPFVSEGEATSLESILLVITKAPRVLEVVLIWQQRKEEAKRECGRRA